MAEIEEELDIRYTRITDETYLRNWLMNAKLQHFLPVSNEQEVHNMLQCWLGFCRYSASLTAILNGTPCGIATLFLMPYQKVSHCCLFKIIVDPIHQNKGVGNSLLKNIIHLAKVYFKLEEIYTEVVEDNPLIHLLRKYDFYQFAEQEDYIRENDRYYARLLFGISLI
ncbi:MAG: GNAT family N-acetyltransferase [Chlamydiales bacterium]|jgi:putative acetyltransferase|nr:GNAT family N-acetyltransferase [Chlamydiales bacterium]